MPQPKADLPTLLPGWTLPDPDWDRYIYREWCRGANCEQLAERWGVTTRTIQRLLLRMGVAPVERRTAGHVGTLELEARRRREHLSQVSEAERETRLRHPSSKGDSRCGRG